MPHLAGGRCARAWLFAYLLGCTIQRMIAPILATKLYTPPLPPNSVPRPRLLHRLDAGLHRKLTLVSAPAGFGKTTLVSAWLGTVARPAVWLSLDEQDGDVARFLRYLVAALGRVVPGAAGGVATALQAPQPPVDELLTPLLNQLAAVPTPFVLVLDDYHRLAGDAVDGVLAFLLDNLPPHLHLVIITREDPRLPLARLRARGHLTEIRAADLRFTGAEAAAFLNQTMGLALSADVAGALERRTEGWVAGLQLAALSMQGADDPAGFVAAFTGSHRFVLDYLTEEVLSQQPPAIQRFLLATSVLDRLCGPLCDAVLADADGTAQAMLADLQRANLFLVPLDNERRWYRYHHLFRDLLRGRLAATPTTDPHLLHTRASQWYEANGDPLAAFQHAAAAGDVARALRLVAGDGIPLHFRGEPRPVLDWFATLPPAAFAAYPAARVLRASAWMITGTEIHRIEPALQAAEAQLAARPPNDDTPDLIGQIAAVRAMLAAPQYHIAAIRDHADRALAHLPPHSVALRTMARWAKGLAHQYLGEREAAREHFAQVVDESHRTGNVMVTIAAQTCLGQLHEADTHLHAAQAAYAQVVALVGEPPWATACEAFLGLARVHYQWDALAEAHAYAEQGLALGTKIENVDTPIACGVVLAEVALARGDLVGAAAHLAGSARLAATRDFTDKLPLVWGARVRVLLAQGDHTGAAAVCPLGALPPLDAVRLLLAQGDPAAALERLGALLDDYTARGWHQERLATLVLLAVARAQAGHPRPAEDTLAEALALAAPGGYVRVFTDAGAPVRGLLAALVARGVLPEAARQRLAAFAGAGAPASPPQPLVDPLSERELEVLRLVAAGLSNREIGERLFLALDTVKGHNRHIYAKLGVSRRTEAVARARALGLL